MGKSKPDFYVDWSDPSFPHVYRWEPEIWQDAQTLTECKEEIIQHFQYQIDHAKARIADVRVLRVMDIAASPKGYGDELWAIVNGSRGLEEEEPQGHLIINQDHK